MSKGPRVLLMADHWVGWQVAKYLRQRKENIVGLVLHPKALEHYSKEIKEASGVDRAHCYVYDPRHEKQMVSRIKALSPDVILCVFWAFLLKRDLFEIPSRGCVNFHAAYLPFNRGKNHNVWPILDGTPAGVTLHYIDERIDAGHIIAQQQVKVEMTDTAKTLYDKLLKAFVPLFKKSWPTIKSGKVKARSQDLKQGTFHLSKDFAALGEIDLDKKYKGRDLINLLRAKTFYPYPGAYFKYNGKKIFLRIELNHDQEA